MKRNWKHGTCAGCLRANMRLVGLGRCSNCYRKARHAANPKLAADHRAYMRQYAREHKRDSVAIDPYRAVRILIAAFAAHDVDVDQLCWWIETTRRMHPLGGSHGQRRPTRHMTRKGRTRCRQS